MVWLFQNMETKGGRQSRPKQQTVLLGCSFFFVESVGDRQPDKGGITFHHALAEVMDNM